MVCSHMCLPKAKSAVFPVLVGLLAYLLFSLSAVAAEGEAARIAQLEQRLLELEARLADQEQATKEVKVLAASGAATAGRISSAITANPLALDIMANSAWRNLRWTREGQWDGIRKGITEEKVVELLGKAPRSVKSLKPRVDKVLYYETSIGDRSSAMRGKISLREGLVVAVSKPTF